MSRRWPNYHNPLPPQPFASRIFLTIVVGGVALGLLTLF